MASVFRDSVVAVDVSREGAATAGVRSSLPTRSKAILFVTNTGEYGGAERHLLELLRRLIGPGIHISILCLDKDLYTEHLNWDQAAQINVIRSKKELKSFRDWYRVFRDTCPDVVVFVRAWLWCYRWHAPVAAWLARVPRRFSIAHLMP